MAWTLPLQLLHFGCRRTPWWPMCWRHLCMTPLTLAALLLALLSLFLPSGPLLVLSWPVSQLAGALIGLVRWISQWPAAQLLTGHPPALGCGLVGCWTDSLVAARSGEAEASGPAAAAPDCAGAGGDAVPR